MPTKFETVGLPQSVTQQGEPTMPDVEGLSGISKGAGHFRTLELTFDSVEVAMTDEAGVVAHGGIKVVDMPEGAYVILGAVADLALVKDGDGINADFDGDFGVGTVVASNNNSLSTTEQNIIPTTATPQAVAGATTAKGVSTAALYLDGTGTPSDLYLNFLIDDADQDGGGDLLVSGKLTVHYVYLGNH